MKISPFSTAVLLSTILATGPAFADAVPSDDNNGIIVVTGQNRADEVSAGTKSKTPLIDTPQSVTVIDSSEIAGLGLLNLNQALRFVAGVTPEQRGASAEVYDQFKLRGFDSTQYLDGLRIFPSPSGYAAPQVDVSRLDKIEIVKGPVSSLYGQSGPGGLVALSSKLPLDQETYGAVAASYGTYNLYRVDADVGGRISSDVLYRIYGSVNGADTQQKFSKRERQAISGAVTVGSGGSTTLTLLGAYSNDPYNGTYGVFPASGTFLPNPNGQLPTSFDGGESGNRFSRKQAAATFILNHDFGGGWNFRSSGRYQNVKSSLGIVYVNGPLDASDPTDQTFSRASYATRERLNSWTYDNQLTGTVKTGPLTHNILIGLDRQVLHSTETAAFGTFPSINGYNPVYGTASVPLTPEAVPGSTGVFSTDYHIRQQGIYAQDEIAVGGLRVSLSGRQDWAKVVPIGSAAEHSKKFTWRAGALYKTTLGISPYVTYSTSFEPQSGLVHNTDDSFSNAPPSFGKQIEGGAKYQTPDKKIQITAAYFSIRQTNVMTYIPIFNYSEVSGKVHSRGVEVEATAHLPYDFDARLAYSRQNVTTEGGGRILGVGRGNSAFNLEWAPKEGPGKGIAIGGAVRHVDEVFAGTYSDGITRNTRPYTLFDALIRYDLGKSFSSLEGFSLAVNAQNVFDKKNISTCYLDYGWCWYGNRRTVQGTIGFHW
jgi:iron complex outermembrane receptor protein